ncbi:hypothetical protein [Pedobacter sp. SYP-B3415]|uniref:hypothetical protein n=1 Tax=Pedobacter sp. SYP-B3415 TaxID=2496641 RepID=UPI0013EAD7BA|nr:hypothetical protein [Pedobacter sp. SYP-B3415]
MSINVDNLQIKIDRAVEEMIHYEKCLKNLQSAVNRYKSLENSDYYTIFARHGEKETDLAVAMRDIQNCLDTANGSIRLFQHREELSS